MELDNEALTKEGMSDRDQKIPKPWREQILGSRDSVNTQHNRFPNMIQPFNFLPELNFLPWSKRMGNFLTKKELLPVFKTANSVLEPTLL